MNVETIKQKYQPKTRIKLIFTNDPYTKLQPGSEGIVDFVDDTGQIHVLWDSGSRLALIPEEDKFRIIKD
ncbi:DUF4314 domain-containing protein [Crocosphaera chwakensis]|uniref:DUF4314 domain-containing protein n=1 Tax=Crocosphaera chwakensis CCY0110 TaxID=391612 RepID=A3ITW1_9CHRO|nr:DUF4314 domain-containing protein [Crocosphaera chwakensis]EAZ90056.1 hypothetical protein CY0110_14960 [Crocosphaera chwakensis CCY0110]